MRGEMLRFSQSNKKLELRITATQNLPKSRLHGPFANKSSKKTLKCVTSVNISLVANGDMGVFLLTSAVLELVRRFSSAHCPFIWHVLQATQILCFPPFTWIHKWASFSGLVKAMQSFSKPLMFLSMATGFLGHSDTSKGTLSGSGADLTELSSQLAAQDTRHVNKVLGGVDMEDWLMELYQELEIQGITIPERLSEDELHRFQSFHDASDGDFAKFLTSVKKTIRWRQEYILLSPQELESWGNLVFWHGSDMMQRPTLVIRVGLANPNLGSNGQAEFVRAVVSQVEHGVLNLLDQQHPQLTVLMDCAGISPFGFPIQTFRSCAVLLQDHYPNRLGCLLVIRLPSVARFITQTLFQVLKPKTQQKLTIVGGDYQEVLSRYFEELPSFLGGRCSCSKCGNEGEERTRIGQGGERVNNTFSDSEGFEGSRLDLDCKRITGVVMLGLLLWACHICILAVYFR